MTFSHTTPIPSSHGFADDCRMYTAPTKPNAISIGPKRLSGRRRTQYRPTNTGPRTRSAFCTASQPGYLRKSAWTVSHTAAADARTAAPPTTSSHHATRGLRSESAHRFVVSGQDPGAGIISGGSRARRAFDDARRHRDPTADRSAAGEC